MMKKIAFFVFAAATSLSASLAGATGSLVYCDECQQQYDNCIDMGSKPPICGRLLRQCMSTCTP